MGRAELEHFRSSMVNIKVGDRTIPAYRSNKCKVCMHPARPLIEERLLMNDTYPSVAEWVSNHDVEEIDGTLVEWPPLNVTQLFKHYNNGHCPIDTQVLHELSKQRMDELGLDYEDSVGRVVDHVVAAKLILAKGQERLARGEIAPDVKDTLSAAKLLHDIEGGIDAGEQSEMIAAWQQAMEVFFVTVQRHVTSTAWQAIGADLSMNPVLREITARIESSDIVDAEEV